MCCNFWEEYKRENWQKQLSSPFTNDKTTILSKFIQ